MTYHFRCLKSSVVVHMHDGSNGSVIHSQLVYYLIQSSDGSYQQNL